MKVCIIDDDSLVVRHLAEMLRELGHDVVTADNVSSGLECVKAQVSDAAVVDILMPERDGLNFIMDIRKIRPDIRIVAITGGGRIGAGPLLKMASGLGADAALVKPFSSTDLALALGSERAATP
jgi:CheY-like chemotaxis protein